MAGGRPLLNYASLDDFSASQQESVIPTTSATASSLDAPAPADSGSWRMTGVCQLDKTSGKPSRMFGMTGGPQLEHSGMKFKAMQTTSVLKPAVKLDSGSLIFNCQNCSKTFVERTSYQAHMSTHVQCEFDGCEHEAIRSVMSKHYMLEHVKKPAAAAVAAAASSRSGISSYIQERKAKFPTKSLIATKAETEQDKVVRGEVLVAQNKHGQFKLTGSDAFLNADGSGPAKKAKNILGTIPSTSKNFTFSSDDLDVDIEWNEDEDISAQPAAVQELLNEAKTTKPQPNHRSKKVKEPQIQGSFLEKLLQPEIRHERNVLLQCIRYIVDNTYFMRPIDLLPHEIKVKPEPADEEELELGEIGETEEREEEVRAASHAFGLANFLQTTINPEGIKHDPDVVAALRASSAASTQSSDARSRASSVGNRSTPGPVEVTGAVAQSVDDRSSDGESGSDGGEGYGGVDSLIGRGTLGEGTEKWTYAKRSRESEEDGRGVADGRNSRGVGRAAAGRSFVGLMSAGTPAGSGGDVHDGGIGNAGEEPINVSKETGSLSAGTDATSAVELEPMDEAEALLQQIEKEYNL